MARDPEQPRGRLREAAAAEAAPVPERHCERLRHQVDRRLGIVRPPLEEDHQFASVAVVELCEVVGIQRHRVSSPSQGRNPTGP